MRTCRGAGNVNSCLTVSNAFTLGCGKLPRFISLYRGEVMRE